MRWPTWRWWRDEDDDGPAPMPPKRTEPKFGGHAELTAVMDVLRGGLTNTEAIAVLIERYPWMTGVGNGLYVEVSAFVHDGRRQLAKGDVAEAERLAHEFVRVALAAKPEPPERTRRSRLARWLHRKENP
jgi:hypothetical protein